MKTFLKYVSYVGFPLRLIFAGFILVIAAPLMPKEIDHIYADMKGIVDGRFV